MTQLENRPFAKMNGIGNSIIVLDLRNSGASVSAAEARAIGRAPGLAYDQLMVVHDPMRSGAAGRLKIFNTDGSVSGACGNGARCVAWALFRDTGESQLVLESEAGRLECSRIDEWRYAVDMGAPRFAWNEIPLGFEVGDTSCIELPDMPADGAGLGLFHAVNMGNPHAVFFVDEPDRYNLAVIGPAIEHHRLFPERVNLSIARIDSREKITLKVWERGAGATLACGSAACATLVAAANRHLSNRKAFVALPGGDLEIEWREKDSHVIMTGDVELEFEGRFDPQIFAKLPA